MFDLYLGKLFCPLVILGLVSPSPIFLQLSYSNLKKNLKILWTFSGPTLMRQGLILTPITPYNIMALYIRLSQLRQEEVADLMTFPEMVQ